MLRMNPEAEFLEVDPIPSVAKNIAQAAEDPKFEPVAPRYAATVMLVRPSVPGQTEYRLPEGQHPDDFPQGQEIEVFMLRRVKTMAFVPDAVVFPGGRVDERDANPELPWCGPSPAQWADYLSCDEATARQVVVAAAREVFEESNVLLAGPDENSVVQDTDADVWETHRSALEAHEESFAEILIAHGLVLRTDLLGLVSNFCTPEVEPRRYDTFFFSALMPDGQVAAGNTTEAQIADWVTPAYAVREGDAGRWLVLPPTMYNLTCIASADNARDFVQERRRLKKIMGVPRLKGDGTAVIHFDLR